MLIGVDLAATSVGKLRSDLEAFLKLPSGGLEKQKDQVSQLIREGIMAKLQAEQSAPAAATKEKGEDEDSKKRKDKKDGKNKDKKAKKAKKDDSSDDSNEAEPVKAEEAPAAVEDAPVVPDAEIAVEPPPDAEAQLATLADDIFELDKGGRSIQQAKTWALSGAEDGSLRLWDLEMFQCVRVFEGHQGAVLCLAAEWSEMRALSGGADGARLWDLRRGGCQKTFAGIEDGCAAIKGNWEADNPQAIGACGDGQIRVWDMKSGELVKSFAAHKGGVWALDADWTNKRLASGGDEEVKIWNTDDWTQIQKIEGHAGGVMCLALDWSEKRVVIGASEQSLRLVDMEAKTGKNMLGHRDVVANVSPDWGRDQILTGGWDAQLRIWNLERNTCTQSHECKFGRIRCMSADFSQMQVICGSSSGALHIVDLYSGAVLREMDGHVGGCTAVAAKF